MNNSSKHHGARPPEARGPMQLHRLHRLKAGPGYTAVLPPIFFARISVSHGWWQDPFIFNLNSTDGNGGMMEDPVEIKASRKITMNFHLRQLGTFWCMQLNASPQLATAALKVLVLFATNNLC